MSSPVSQSYIIQFIVIILNPTVPASVPTLSEVECEFEPHLGQTKDYKIDICIFSSIK